LTACLILLFAHGVAAAEGEGLKGHTLKGRSLVDVIESLEGDGLLIYYSSDLVRPWMTVREEPAATVPVDILDEILAPYELTTEAGPQGGVLIVRRGGDTRRATGSILGVVKSTGSDRRISGARITVEGEAIQTVTSPRGQFSLKDLPPGTYRIQVSATDRTIDKSQEVKVAAGDIEVVQVYVDSVDLRELETVTVNASRYDLNQERFHSFHYMPIENVRNLPDFGDDPLRAVARLPGTATGGFAGKSNIRGGEVDETLVRFDGLRLRNPFHLKDFQSIFSAIDPAIISGMDVYTGGAPVVFGDRMSGVIDLTSIEIPVAPYHEISQTFFNSSVLTAGSTDDGETDWVVSARRGNLDLILDIVDSDLGDPRYFDVFARYGVQATDTLRVTGNVMVFDDDISASDSDQEENANATYRDEYFWVTFEQILDGGLTGRSIFAHSDLTSDRDGTVEQEGVTTGWVDDERSFTINTFQTDWSWRATDRFQLDFGAETSHSEGDYEYRNQAEFDLIFLTPGAPKNPELETDIDLDVDGDQYGAYVNGRYALTDRLIGEVGVRWDRQTITEDSEDLFSPRVGAMYEFGDHTTLRANWGRHYQSQGIDELQVIDGVTSFFDSQRADHFIASVEHRTRYDVDLRVEAFHKEMDRLRPRYENMLNTRILLPEIRPDRIEIAPETARARGVEVSVTGEHLDSLGWWLSYTRSWVKDEFDDGNIRRTWDQQNAVFGGIEWRYGPWTLNVAGTYSTGWPTTEAELVATEPEALVATGLRNTERLGSYKTLDVRLARDWRLPASDLTAFVEVTNVLNRRNDCCIEYEVEENDETEELSLELDSLEYFNIFPNVGFVWRFGKGAVGTR
jgi:outer membrane receptor protein involved in Fe transport